MSWWGYGLVIDAPGDGWGNNPGTVEAVGTAAAALFAVIAAFIAWRSWRASRSEIVDRMRPWVGLYDFKFIRDDFGQPRLFVLLRNCGPLPAQKAHLIVEMRPRTLERYGEVVVPVRSEKFEEKVLVPNEDGQYGIKLESYPQIEEWIAARRDVEVKGTFTYELGKRKFELRFQAELWFSRPKPPTERARWFKKATPTKLVQTNWRNVYAS